MATKAKAKKTVTKKVTAKPKAEAPQIDMSKANSANLVWPTDIWGVTRGLKKELTKVISRCAGHPDKMKMLDELLAEAEKYRLARDAETTARFKAMAEKAKADAEAAE